MERVYLDYAASAPLLPEVKEAISDFVAKYTGANPSSLHTEGRKMQALLDKAHTTVAAVFGVQPTEVIFTSGATESNNLAIRGVLRAWRAEHATTPHMVLTAIEHASWRQAAHDEDAEVTVIPVSKDGVVSVDHMLAAIQDNTALVGCMYVNNEIGTVQPVAAIGKAITEQRGNNLFPVFHVDAVQAFPYFNTHFGHVRADMLTISGHKYGALGGTGALLVKKHTPLKGVIKGGSQEWGYRAGTENVLGALTLAKAVEIGDANREHLTEHVAHLHASFEENLTRAFPDLKIIGSGAERAPHITYFWVPDVTNETLVQTLDLAGFAIASGSACSSGAMLPSATLLALGFSDDEAFGGIRVSYGRGTTHKELQQFIETLRSKVA